MEERCHICLHALAPASASVKGCQHTFCLECVQQWVRSRPAPACPLCKADITVLVLADGSEQAAEPGTSAGAEEELDLSCLDHGYFLAEVLRLLSRANSVNSRLVQDAYGCGRKGGGHATQRCLDGVADVLGALSSYRDSLESELRFEPEVLLQELYCLDRQLSSLSAGEPDDSEFGTGGSLRGAAAGDYEHSHDCYDDDDDDDDDWHDGLTSKAAMARTPGRRPQSRQQRSGSQQQRSGSQQQQQQRQQQQHRVRLR